MLFRRVKAHVEQENWFSVAVDFFIVVVGVFVGIQVANWNQASQESALQSAYIERLSRDFGQVRGLVKRAMTTYEEGVAGATYLADLARGKPPSETESDITQVAQAWLSINQTRLAPPLPATYLEMVSEGKLSGMQDPSLRDKLAEYVTLQSVLEVLIDHVLNNQIAGQIKLEQHFDSTTIADESRASGIRDQMLGYDLAGIQADKEFLPIVNARRRLFLNSLQLRKTQIGLIDEIMVILDENKTK